MKLNTLNFYRFWVLLLSVVATTGEMKAVVVEGSDGRLSTGVLYRIESKWHKDHGKEAILGAAKGSVCRSGEGNLYASWFLEATTARRGPAGPMTYRLVNKGNQDSGQAAFLDADSDHRDGRVYLSKFLSCNTAWYVTIQSDGSFMLQDKWHNDQGKPSSLEAPMDHPGGLVRRSHEAGPTAQWYFTDSRQADVESALAQKDQQISSLTAAMAQHRAQTSQLESKVKQLETQLGQLQAGGSSRGSVPSTVVPSPFSSVAPSGRTSPP